MTNELNYAGFFRRLFAIFYDCVLLIAILFIVSAIFTALNNGKAVEAGDNMYPVFIVVILSLSYLYFSWFWIHGGQTLGMKTWRIQLQTGEPLSDNDSQIGWRIATVRFLTAIISWCVIGLGFLWALFDKKKRCWHDLLSKTVLIDLRTNT